ncbi:MAG: hypothetical protein J6K41_02820 [Paraprevotella sp.]|nr:hypothetical protein [Paraprevotella sp.]
MKRTYVWATLLLSFGLCGLSLTSCGDDDDDVLTEVTVPGNGDDNNPDSGDDGDGNGEGEGDGKEDEGDDGKPDLNGHEAIDLGLSVKWATCNVGANAPEEYGGYYAWGETEEKAYYDWSTYKYSNGSSSTLTKYCMDGYYGTVDNKTVLDPEDDVAHVKWGGSWRMPTSTEIRELRENCSWTWTTQNGVNGYVVTSKSNGNCIFLPAAGSRWYESVDNSGSIGYYWSASLSEYNSHNACNLYFDGGSRLLDYNGNLRYHGFSVRPVTE